MTEKLYYQDSHRKEFEAQVVSCQWNEKKEWYEVILDRTVFFPEGGGQYADPGVIDGIPVEDVKEREGEVIHMMKKPLMPGQTVHGEIDYKERFSRMQQHSGEHIVSGLVHRYFGYDNVGFKNRTDSGMCPSFLIESLLSPVCLMENNYETIYSLFSESGPSVQFLLQHSLCRGRMAGQYFHFRRGRNCYGRRLRRCPLREKYPYRLFSRQYYENTDCADCD